MSEIVAHGTAAVIEPLARWGFLFSAAILLALILIWFFFRRGGYKRPVASGLVVALLQSPPAARRGRPAVRLRWGFSCRAGGTSDAEGSTYNCQFQRRAALRASEVAHRAVVLVWSIVAPLAL